MATRHRLGIVMLTTLALAATLGAISPPVAQGASTCRVRNATRDTYGSSLIRMVAKARDGDRLWVAGTCAGEIVIDVDITIRGVSDPTILTGRGRNRVVQVLRGAVVRLRDLTIQRGRPPRGDSGGGILSRGRLTLVDSVVSGNVVTAARGGGLANLGRATVIDSVVRGNVAAGGYGGGIANPYRGRLTLVDSVMRGNRAGAGGGLYVNRRGAVTMHGSSSIRGNTAVHGGGVDGMGVPSMEAILTMNDRSSIRGNTATGYGDEGGYGGGAILIDATIVMNDSSSITHNTGGQGGGVSIDEGWLWMNDASLITRNAGGGVLNWDGVVYGFRCAPDPDANVYDNTPYDCLGLDW